MAWDVELDGERIRLWAPYNQRALPLLKGIPGGRWRDEDKSRGYPLRWQVCQDLRKVAQRVGVELKIGPLLWAWAIEEKERQEKMPSVGDLEGYEFRALNETNPKLASAARPFQAVGIGFISLNREVLIADEPGLGKTLQSIGGVQEAGITGPILVVAPKAAIRITWPYELELWAPGEKYGIIGAHLNVLQREAKLEHVRKYCEKHPDERFWVLTTVEYIRIKAETDEFGNYVYNRRRKVIQPVTPAVMGFFDAPWASMIVDESHKTLACSTNNKKKWSAQRLGLGALDFRQDAIKVALSGTPFRGKKENLFGTLQWLRPDLYTSYWRWAERHFRMEQDDFTGNAHPTDDLIDPTAFYEETAKVMIRRTKSQVASELPSKMYAGWPLEFDEVGSPIAVWLDMEPKQKAQYKSIVKHGGVNLDGGNMLTYGILSEITRLRQFANASHWKDDEGKIIPDPDSSNKTVWIKDWLEERGHMDGRPTGKVIIASQFTSYLNALSLYLGKGLTGNGKNGVRHYLLTGETPDARRKEMQRKFQVEGENASVFLINTHAGGVSLTLDMADDVIIVDQTSIPDDQEQVEDRAHRISRLDHQVTIWYLASIGSIEEAIARTATSRDIGIKAVIDGERGIEVLKKLREM